MPLFFIAVVTFNCADRNPCGDSSYTGYYFKHEDPTKYVQCGTVAIQCYIMQCREGLVWDDDIKACDWPKKAAAPPVPQKVHHKVIAKAKITKSKIVTANAKVPQPIYTQIAPNAQPKEAVSKVVNQGQPMSKMSKSKIVTDTKTAIGTKFLKLGNKKRNSVTKPVA